MVRSVGRERDGSKTGNEQNERARILKLVALGQNEGKSSVRLRTTLLPPDTGQHRPWKYEILRKIRAVNCFYTLIRIYAPSAPPLG